MVLFALVAYLPIRFKCVEKQMKLGLRQCNAMEESRSMFSLPLRIFIQERPSMLPTLRLKRG